MTTCQYALWLYGLTELSWVFSLYQVVVRWLFRIQTSEGLVGLDIQDGSSHDWQSMLAVNWSSSGTIHWNTYKWSLHVVWVSHSMKTEFRGGDIPETQLKSLKDLASEAQSLPSTAIYWSNKSLRPAQFQREGNQVLFFDVRYSMSKKELVPIIFGVYLPYSTSR